MEKKNRRQKKGYKKEENSDTANNQNALFGLSESLNNPAGQLIDLLVQ